MEYHVITKGSGWAAIVGESPVRLETGDIVMFPHGDAHVLSSAPGMRPLRFGTDWVFATRNEPKPMPIASHNGIKFTIGTPSRSRPRMSCADFSVATCDPSIH